MVASEQGPEAGVWVIAETQDLPTKYIKIVVTDDDGEYVLPDLPEASYDVWVRGYGLVDSPKVQSARGQHLNLTAVVAPDAAATAQVLPGKLLVCTGRAPFEERFSGDGAEQQRHPGDAADSRGLARQHQDDQRLHSVPPDGDEGYA